MMFATNFHRTIYGHLEEEKNICPRISLIVNCGVIEINFKGYQSNKINK